MTALLDVAVTNFAYTGILSFSAFLGMPNFVGYCISIVVSILGSFFLTMFVMKVGEKK